MMPKRTSWAHGERKFSRDTLQIGRAPVSKLGDNLLSRSFSGSNGPLILCEGGRELRLVHRPGRVHARIEFDLAERRFVLRYVLLQNRQQGFRLLRAYIDALKIGD